MSGSSLACLMPALLLANAWQTQNGPVCRASGNGRGLLLMAVGLPRVKNSFSAERWFYGCAVWRHLAALAGSIIASAHTPGADTKNPVRRTGPGLLMSSACSPAGLVARRPDCCVFLLHQELHHVHHFLLGAHVFAGGNQVFAVHYHIRCAADFVVGHAAFGLIDLGSH